MGQSLFLHSDRQPFHLSVGVLVYRADGRMLVHYHAEAAVRGQRYRDLYVLVRESVEDAETLEEAVHRGVREETGASVVVHAFLGDLHERWTIADGADHDWQKTTVYFLVELTEWDPGRRDPNDPEAGSNLLWLEPRELELKLDDTARRYPQMETGEGEIVRRALNWLEKE